MYILQAVTKSPTSDVEFSYMTAILGILPKEDVVRA